MAYHASVEALKEADVKAEDIDLILVATVTPDTAFPSIACLIQDRLGAVNAAAMDIGAACAGFMYGVITANQFIAAGTYKKYSLSELKSYPKLQTGQTALHVFYLVMVLELQ